MKKPALTLLLATALSSVTTVSLAIGFNVEWSLWVSFGMNTPLYVFYYTCIHIVMKDTLPAINITMKDSQ